MDRLRQLRDTIKESYNKACCVKVVVGVAVGIVLLIVIVVVSTVVGGGGDGGGSDGGGTNAGNPSSVVGNKTLEVTTVWQHQFTVQLPSQGFSQILAIDDVSRRYVIEINSNDNYNIYIIVDFPKKQHVYVIVEKGGGDGNTKAEKSVLSCESSPFGRDFTGSFTSSSALRSGGASYEEDEKGRTVTVNAAYAGAPYTVRSPVAAVLNGSCSTISPDNVFKWDSELSVCGDNTTLEWDVPCDNSHCPILPTTSQSIEQACISFRRCNHLMARCFSPWSLPDYDGLPYCLCRRNIISDLDNIVCPSEQGSDREACQIPKQDVNKFETEAACYCRYSLTRVYPILSSSSSSSSSSSTEKIGWEMGASVVTAPSRKFGHCPC